MAAGLLLLGVFALAFMTGSLTVRVRDVERRLSELKCDGERDDG